MVVTIAVKNIGSLLEILRSPYILSYLSQVPQRGRQGKQRVFVITCAAADGIFIRPALPVREFVEREFECVQARILVFDCYKAIHVMHARACRPPGVVV